MHSLRISSSRMSSREMAELTGKQHNNVVRDIINMFKGLDIRPEGYAQNWVHPQNKQTYVEYMLDQDLTTCLLTGYDVKARMKVIKRWKELESTQPKELTRLEILTMALEAEQKVLTLEQDKKILQEVAQNLTAQFTVGLTAPEFCKQLNGVNLNKVQSFLVDKGILKKSSGDTTGYLVVARYRDKFFKQEFEKYKDKTRGYAVILPDGAKWLYKKYHKGELAMNTTWNQQLTHDLYVPTQPSLALAVVK